MKTILMMTQTAFCLFLFMGLACADSKLNCNSRDLKAKNCYLSLGKNRVHVWRDKIFLNDLIERDTKPIVISASEQLADKPTDKPTDKLTDKLDLMDWHFVKAKKINERWFLELGLWSPPHGVGEFESLWWLVYEIKNGQYVKHIEKLIQKRKQITDKSTDKITDRRFKYDKLANYGLQQQNKKIQWHVNHNKGSIE